MAAEDVAFRAMGSDAHVIVVDGPPGLAERARRRIEQLERRWSRFLPDSEISRLTQRAGEWVELSGDSVLLVERALDAWRLTVGRFDPTVLGAVIRAGYDRSFENLGRTVGDGDSPLTVGAAGIQVEGDRARLPAGVGFDPGGIGKGLAADLAVAEALVAGAAGACVNLGGDLRVAGLPPGHRSCVDAAWTVGIEHPWSPEPLALLGLHEGAVATSTTLRRRWRTTGRERHHLIDPWTGAPSASDLTLAAVVTAEAWVAEVLAKSVLLRGSTHAFDLVAGLGADALTVDGDGVIRSTAGLSAFLGGIPLPRSISRGRSAPPGHDPGRPAVGPRTVEPAGTGSFAKTTNLLVRAPLSTDPAGWPRAAPGGDGVRRPGFRPRRLSDAGQ
ncbi:MAG TPA: FAD:protein FMN transferase [Acidimicrobiia bacterium]|nr:FAD:protein FMN transferase [Acidimicrobiia bacterium]